MNTQQVIEYLDRLEADLYRQYIQLRRTRLALQAQHRITPQNRQDDERDKE